MKRKDRAEGGAEDYAIKRSRNPRSHFEAFIPSLEWDY